MQKLLILACLTFASLASFSLAVPAITSISESKIVEEGKTHALSVNATGSGPLAYQWDKDGTPMSPETAATLSFPTVMLSDTGRYTVTISDDNGSTTSDTVLLDVSEASPPRFNNSSRNTSYNIGQSLSLSRSLSGTSPFTYQWFYNAEAITGATNSSLYFPTTTAADAGTYTLQATNFKGTATSNPIYLSPYIIGPPQITSQPRSVIISEGGSSSISMSFNGSQVTLSLLRDQTVVRTSSYQLSFSNATLADAGEYRIRVSNSQGSTTSEPFMVYVEPASPVAVTVNQPNGPFAEGNSLSLSGNYYSPNNITLQWFKNGLPIAGATSSSYYKTAALSDAGAYHLEAYQGTIVSVSNPVAVSIRGGSDFFITNHPASIGYELGSSDNLSVSVSNSGNFTYIWTRDGTVLANQTSDRLYLNQYGAEDVFGSYVVTVSNGDSSVSSLPAIVSSRPAFAPVISQQPQSRTLTTGNYGSIGVQAFGSPNPTYQWFKNDVPVENATSRNYSFNNAEPSMNGSYHVEISNSAGTVSSESAIISVTAAAGGELVITQHPSSNNALAGSNRNLNVALSQYTNTMTYQWFKDDAPIAGATQRDIYIRGEPRNDGQYHLVVTDGPSSVTSEKATFQTYLTSELPLIASYPGSRAQFTGYSVNFSISPKNGAYDATYIWHKDGELIPQQNGNSLYVQATASNEGYYTAKVFHGDQSFTVPPMRLIVLGESDNSVSIASNPTSIALSPGTSGGFSVQARNAISYQWFKDNTPVPLATDSNLNINSASTEITGVYHVVVTGANGATVTSAPAALTLLPGRLPIITYHPQSSSVDSLNSSPSISVNAISNGPTSYQWFRDDSAILGANNYYLNLNNYPAGIYHVSVTNSVGTVESRPATFTRLTSLDVPTITQQPSSVSSRSSGFVSFRIKASGDGDLAYQWYHDGTAIPGANASQHTIASAQTEHIGTYTVTVSNSAGIASSLPATLTIAADTAPVITLHPTSRIIDAGLNTTLSVTATGNPAPTYQWQRNGVDLFGATNSLLALANVQAAHTGTYTVRVSNSAGSVLSQSAQVSLSSSGAPVVGFHHVKGNGYTADESVTIAVRLNYADDIASLGYQVLLPDGWSYVGSTATNTVSSPQSGDQSLLEWAWADFPAGPLTFTFELTAPAEATGSHEIVALVVARRANEDFSSLANPDPLTVEPASEHHTADLNRDGKLGLSELLRVIEFYNTRHQSSRTGRYILSADTPDGFAPDATQPLSVESSLSRYHLADIDRNGRLNLSELLRVIELYNTRSGSTRTGTYRQAIGTTDGFEPGAGGE